ncbi:MAG: glycosyltransferase [Candidatus Nanopelagicales bacterium]
MNEILTNWAACIVYYQDQESLLNLLESLERQSLKPGYVFITDNNSIKSIALKNYSFPVQITKLGENKGFAAGANLALKNAINNNFNNLMLLSQDVILDSSSAEQMIVEIVKSKGIVFPTMYNRNTNQIFSKGGSVNKLSGSIKLSILKGLTNPEWADGSCLVFTKEVFKSVEGFYEKFFMYFEDVDFCYRAKSKGFTLKHVDTKVSQTPKGPNPLLRSKNSVIFARRTGSILLKSSVTKRNILGAFLLFARLRLADSKNRFIGVIQGWKAAID